MANTNVSLRFHECLDPKTMFLVLKHFFFFFGFSGDFVSRKNPVSPQAKLFSPLAAKKKKKI